jgi:hypothetical protein
VKVVISQGGGGGIGAGKELKKFLHTKTYT